VNQFIAAKPKGAGPASPDPAPSQAPAPQELERPLDTRPTVQRAPRRRRKRDVELLEEMLEYLEQFPRKQVGRVVQLLARMR
jgi:hypothetical protein